MLDKYGIESGHIETVHSFTNDQNLVDNQHKSARRGRSAPMNMVIKMVEARPEGQGWLPVVKLSDVPTKNTGDPEMIALAKKVLSMGSS